MNDLINRVYLERLISMSVGLNSPLMLTQYVARWLGLVLGFQTMYDTYMIVLYVIKNRFVNPIMGVGLKLPYFINPKCV